MRKKMVYALVSTLVGVGMVLATTVGTLFAENYYVDAETGADENTGTSPEKAWKTLKNVNQHPFQPGDVISLRAGQVWRGTIRPTQSGEEGKPITYTRYGKGKNPALWGSVDLAKEELWTEVEPGIWATKPDDVEVKGDYAEFWTGNWSCYTEGAAKTSWKVKKTTSGKKVYTISTHEATKRDCDIQLNYATFKIEPEMGLRFCFRARLTQGNSEKNLLDDAKAQELVRAFRIIQATSPWGGFGSLVKSSWTVGEKWTEFDVVLRTTVTEMKNNARVSFFIGPMLPKDSEFSFMPVSVQRAEVKSVGLFREVGNIIMKKKGTENQKDSEITAWKRWGVDKLVDIGDYYYDIPNSRLYFKSDENPAHVYSMMEAAGKCNLFDLGKQHHILVEGLTFAYSGGHGLRGGPGCQHCVVRGNDFLWIGGSWLYTRGPIPTRYGNGIEFWEGNEDLLIENNYFYQIYDTAMTNQGPGAGVLKDMVWRGNRCEKCEQCYEIWFTSPDMTVESLTVENSDFRDSGFGWSHDQRPDKRATHFLAYGLEAKVGKIRYENNYLGRTKQHMVWFFNPRVSEFGLNHNEYVQPVENLEETPLFMWGGQPKEGVTFAKYRELTGNDKDSTLKNK